ncbi:hypothetical protein KUTeg_003673 [Tegillarca granosa]|uniref:STAS domain-containing protein n=1 Tax=Tegillarca granosa TaxID=220873 RepID=A0ABQ9FRL0_TEGGR|nr:hypothetical protein KUTeg_003673 [Tegillarca granosa]
MSEGQLKDLQCDLIAGFTVALTVMPQGLAYAKIAQLPPQDITLGPTAIMSLMTAAFASSPVSNDPTYAILMCLMCGIIQFVMGLFNLGILVNFISYPVINAFTSAAAITIAVGQLKGILGLHDIPREFLHMVYETCAKIPETNVWDLTMGLICLVVLFGLKKLRALQWNDDPNDPPPGICKPANAIVVVTASGVVAILLSQNIDVISKTGDLTPGLPPFRIPDFSLHSHNVTKSTGEIFTDIGAGFIIVPLLGLVELIAIGKAFARQNNYKIKPTQELIAVGIANMVSCLVSSYPVTGSFSRTAVNSQSGVRTPASGIVTGISLLMLLYPMARPSNRADYKEEMAHNLGVTVVTLDSGLKFPAIEYVHQKVIQAAQSESKGTRSVILDCGRVSGIDYSTVQGITEIIADLKRNDAQIVFAGLPKNILEHLQSAEIPGLLVSSSVEEGCKLLQDETKPLTDEDGLKLDSDSTIIVEVNNHHSHL